MVGLLSFPLPAGEKFRVLNMFLYALAPPTAHPPTHPHREVCRMAKAKQRADIKRAVKVLNTMGSTNKVNEPESIEQEENR